jgi:hypothetical protein
VVSQGQDRGRVGREDQVAGSDIVGLSDVGVRRDIASGHDRDCLLLDAQRGSHGERQGTKSDDNKREQKLDDVSGWSIWGHGSHLLAQQLAGVPCRSQLGVGRPVHRHVGVFSSVSWGVDSIVDGQQGW